MSTKKEIILTSRPSEHITNENVKFVEGDIPKLESDGEILVKVLYLSVDPSMRPKMTRANSYTALYELDKPLYGKGIAQVIESKNEHFKAKDFLSGAFRWNTSDKYSAQEIKQFGIEFLKPEFDLPEYLHVLGLNGLTAHVGLMQVGKPKEGDVVLVSGAAGATGSVVGQIAKLKGCRVIGIAGSEEKVKLLTTDFKFDHVINYKTEDIAKKLAELVPNGVNVYYDNVGGSVLDAALLNMAPFGRVVCCGSISGYNTKPEPVYNYGAAVFRKLTIQGFIYTDFASQFPAALKELETWLKEGKLKSEKSMSEGIDSMVDALRGLFEGKNTGKQIVHIGDPL